MAGESKAEIAYRYIRTRIEDGRFVPGYRLVLGQVASALDMSVVPVREAIRMLEAEGFIDYERNVGAQVALIQATEYGYTMETLALIEGFATALSAPHIPAEHIARARAINEGLRDSLPDFEPRSFTARNLDFHAVLFEHCPNPHILDLVHRGWRRMAVLRDSSFAFVPHRADESVDEHEQILQLIEAEAPAAEIEAAARAHRMRTLDAVRAQQTEHKHPSPFGAPMTRAS